MHFYFHQGKFSHKRGFNFLNALVARLVFHLQLFLQQFDVLLHGFVLVKKMPYAVVEVFVLALEVGLAPSTAHVVFFALAGLVDRKVLLRKGPLAVLARQLGLLTVHQVVSDF